MIVISRMEVEDESVKRGSVVERLMKWEKCTSLDSTSGALEELVDSCKAHDSA